MEIKVNLKKKSQNQDQSAFNLVKENPKIETSLETTKEIKIQNKKIVKDIYPKARQGHDTYNEVYQYLKYKNRPERIVNKKSFQNWKMIFKDAII